MTDGTEDAKDETWRATAGTNGLTEAMDDVLNRVDARVQQNRKGPYDDDPIRKLISPDPPPDPNPISTTNPFELMQYRFKAVSDLLLKAMGKLIGEPRPDLMANNIQAVVDAVNRVAGTAKHMQEALLPLASFMEREVSFSSPAGEIHLGSFYKLSGVQEERRLADGPRPGDMHPVMWRPDEER